MLSYSWASSFRFRLQSTTQFYQWALFFSVMFTTSYPFKMHCPPDWVGSPVTGTCLKLETSHYMRLVQSQKCREQGGRVAHVPNCQQQTFLEDQFRGKVKEIDVGIGAQQKDAHGPFFWEGTNDQVTYKDWAGGEPNKYSQPLCLVLSSDFHNKWKTVGCQSATPSVCERTPEYVCGSRKFGKNCSQTCSSYCYGDDGECDVKTGHCLEGCIAGFHGPLCDKQCGSGTYGRNCQNQCSHFCLGGMKYCDRFTGTCTHGCSPGFLGYLCSHVCYTGYYGKGCTKNCSEHCAGVHKACDEITGKCFQGCEVGFQGDRCIKAQYHLLGVSLYRVLITSVMFMVIWMSLVYFIIGLQNNCGEEETPGSDKHDDFRERRSWRASFRYLRHSFKKGRTSGGSGSSRGEGGRSKPGGSKRPSPYEQNVGLSSVDAGPKPRGSDEKDEKSSKKGSFEEKRSKSSGEKEEERP